MAAWTPAQLPGVGTWLKADSLSLTNNDPVSTWADSSGNSRDGSMTGANRPTYKTGVKNSLPGLLFNATHALDIAGLGTLMSGDDTYSLLVVSQPTALGGFPIVMTYPTTGTWTWLVELDPSGAVYWGHGNPKYRLYGAGIIASDYPLLSMVKTSSSAEKFWKDGTEVTIYTTNGGTDGIGPTPSMSGAIRLGSYHNFTTGLVGYIFEVIYCSGSLSDTDRQKAEGYLAHKWALTSQLPIGHPYKSIAPGGPEAIVAATEGADTAASTGAVAIAGQVAATEAADLVSGAASVFVLGNLSATEASDGVSSASDLPLAGALSLSEADDTLAAASLNPSQASAAVTEGADELAATASVPVLCSLGIAEGADAIAISASLGLAASLATEEGADSVSARLVYRSTIVTPPDRTAAGQPVSRTAAGSSPSRTVTAVTRSRVAA